MRELQGMHNRANVCVHYKVYTITSWYYMYVGLIDDSMYDCGCLILKVSLSRLLF